MVTEFGLLFVYVFNFGLLVFISLLVKVTLFLSYVMPVCYALVLTSNMFFMVIMLKHSYCLKFSKSN